MAGVELSSIFNRFSTGARAVASNVRSLIDPILGRTRNQDVRQLAEAVGRLQQNIDALQAEVGKLDITSIPLLNLTDAAGKPTAWMGIKVVGGSTYKGGYFSNLYIGSSEAGAEIYADDTGVYVNGSVMVLGTITAAAFNILVPVLEGITWADNDPGGGSISWTSGTVHYAGTSQAITGANTALTYVYWDAGDSTFTAAASFTPQRGRFLIATNVSGTADEAWNKLGSQGVQTINLLDLAVTTEKINLLAVDTAQIAAAAIETAKINNLAVTTAKINTLAVDTAQIAAAAITNAKINDLDAGKISAGTIAAARIGAGTISSDKLNATQIDVGGGSGKPGQFRIYDGTPTQIGWIGVDGGDVGAWFKTLAIGGANYAGAKLKADGSGNVSVTGTLTYSSDGFTITIDNTLFDGDRQALIASQDSDGASATHSYNGFALFDDADHYCGGFFKAASSPWSGQLWLNDGLATGGILGNGEQLILTGVNGVIQMTGDLKFKGNATISFDEDSAGGGLLGSAGASAGYLTVKHRGTDYKIQLFAMS